MDQDQSVTSPAGSPTGNPAANLPAVAVAAATELEYNQDYRIFTRIGEFRRQDHDVIGEVIRGDCYRLATIPTTGDASEVVVDIGAHIGTFSHLWNDRNPLARIACVECCPENYHCLAANVGRFAEIFQAACTYEAGPLKLLNSIKQAGTATGGSTVVSQEDTRIDTYGHLYWEDNRELSRVTLQQIMDQLGVDHIDVLKLDCEGSEFSILGKCSDGELSRVKCIVGEYHGREKFLELIQRRFSDGSGWLWTDQSQGDLGYFRLDNERFGK